MSTYPIIFIFFSVKQYFLLIKSTLQPTLHTINTNYASTPTKSIPQHQINHKHIFVTCQTMKYTKLLKWSLNTSLYTPPPPPLNIMAKQWVSTITITTIYYFLKTKWLDHSETRLLPFKYRSTTLISTWACQTSTTPSFINR
jgi:hypothetical protein